MGKLNIIVVGATGYTGKILCEYLKSKRIESWGIAGRNEEKLEVLKKELDVRDLPVFVVDFDNAASLDKMCGQAVCVISCAGPFTEVGMPIVDACVRCQTHYIDSTGEYNFVRLVAEKYHQTALERGIVLVSCCGFDSTPSDVGNYVVHQQAEEPVTEVKAYIRCVSAGMSSGTANSMGAVLSAIDKKDLLPYSLNPPDAVTPTAAPVRKGVWYDREEGKWSCPFVMAACNERVVRRSNALRGSSAVYSESMEGPFFKVAGATVAMYSAFTTLLVRPVRNLLLNTFYKRGNGYGPSSEKKKGCFYTITFIGRTSSGKRVEVQLHDDREMYDVTGLYLGECALSACELHAEGKVKPGVLTPSVAFGDRLVERLKKENIKITTNVAN